MKAFSICSLTLLASLGSAQINVDSGSERIDVTGGGGGNDGGDGDVNTRFFTTGNTGIDSFIGAAAGTVAANLAGGLFNGYRERCRFKRQAADTKTGATDVDTRLICLNDLLPKKVDCNRCYCSERDCRDCSRCREPRQPDCYRCSCSRERDCSYYCTKCSYNSGGGGGRPWSSGSSGSSYRPQTQRPSYRPTTYRPPYNTGWRNGGNGDDTKSSGSGGGVSFVNQ